MITTTNRPIDISVVIPAFNRIDLLRASVTSVLVAARRVTPMVVECIVVDDGSDPPLASQLSDLEPGFAPHTLRTIRQLNSGSAAARLHGLRESQGEYVQFLDSDDRLHPNKLAAHVAAMKETGAELSYCDQAITHPYDPLGDFEDPPFVSRQQLPVVNTPAELFIGVQTSPHTPVFRRDPLVAALADPIIPPSRAFEPAGDTWLFFNCATQPWRVCKVNGFYSVYVTHEIDRLSTKWEKLGTAALGIMLIFALRCPEKPENRAIQAMLGTAALQSYRRLPLRFHAEYERLTLALFQTSPPGVTRNQLGGRQFARLAAVVGPSWAARLLRRVQCKDYRTCQTIGRDEMEAVFAKMIDHVKAVCGNDRFKERFDKRF